MRKSKMGMIIISIMTVISTGAILLVAFNSELNKEGVIGTLISSLVMLPIIFLFYSSKLTVRIDQSQIRYRFFPFQFKEKELKWTEVNSAHVRKYSPLKEFGGWGYKRNLLRNSVCLNVSGKVGLEVNVESGKTIMIGTQKEAELRNFIDKLELNNG